jgi:hypothetical protein
MVTFVSKTWARPGLDRNRLSGNGDDVIAIQPGNKHCVYLSGTCRFAFVVVSAIPEPELIHFPNHSFVPFRLPLRQQSEM